MDVRTAIQEKLDKILLPDGVLSFHIRRVEVDAIEGHDVKVNPDEYAVFRLVSSPVRTFGDGDPLLKRHYVEVNYYYKYDKTDPRYAAAAKRLKAVKKEILQDRHFRLANDESDIPNTGENPYRGITVEFLYVGVMDYE